MRIFFLSLLTFLYRDSCCLVKVDDGRSCLLKVQSRIRQGYTVSRQLYSLAIEAFLAVLRAKLSGLIFPGLSQHHQLVVSAYADDISVFVRDQRDVDSLSLSLDLVYLKAFSLYRTDARQAQFHCCDVHSQCQE